MTAGPALEVFRHQLKSIVEEMGVTLQRTAYSTNIKIRRDHTCALFDADLRHVAQHDVAPQHIGSLISVVPRNMPDWEGRLEPGDGILLNDPYKGAVHLPDVMVLSPLFRGDEIVGYAANSAHHVDIGGETPGGIPPDATSIYGEGIVIPGIKAIRNWEYDDQILALISRNVRDPDMRLGDYRAQLAANRIAERRYVELVDRYGADHITGHIDDLLDYTERLVRAAIAELPDGTYAAEDYMDGDGVVDEPVKLALAITIDGEEVTLDFTGTAPENRGPLNCTPAMAFAGSMSVLMALIGEDLPKNLGFYRLFDTIAPEGTMVNPSQDRPVAAGWEIAMRCGELVMRALADALPEEVVAGTKGMVCNIAYGGIDPRDDAEYVYYETVAGGYGGRATKDGMDAVQTHFQNTANSPIEELEREIPLHVRRYEMIRDSGGPGRNRGGLGVRRDLEFYDHEASFTLLTDRTKSRPWGLFGGEPGRAAAFFANPDTDDERPLGSKSTTRLDPDGVASIQTPGGGGYGDPLEREPGRVLEDVVNEKVSVESAREHYGVVVNAAERAVDEAATAARREELAAEGAAAEAGTDASGGGGDGDGDGPAGGRGPAAPGVTEG